MAVLYCNDVESEEAEEEEEEEAGLLEDLPTVLSNKRAEVLDLVGKVVVFKEEDAGR
jgi:hypothetical protein